MNFRILILLLSVFTSAVSCDRKPDGDNIDSIAANFAEPPREARPYVWWHWMFGYVSQEGILKDLSWMDRAGIAGFHQFDAGGLGMAKAADIQYPYFSDGWKEMFRYALHVADSLGMDVTIASAPGWSSTGGRWVTPQDAMKKLEWRSIETDGGGIKVKLPPLYRTVGPYQDFEQLNDRIKVEPCGEDIAVMAVRIPDDDFSACGRVASDSLITFSFDSDVTVHAVTLKSFQTGGRPYRGEGPYRAVLETSADRIRWETVKHLNIGRLPYLTENFQPLPGQYFRIRGKQLAGATLHGAHRIEHSEEQGAFAVPGDLHRFLTPQTAASGEVLDLTGKMSDDGTLETVLPQGKWRIYRFGWSITGKVNHPANPEATGLEVDKLDSAAWMGYFHTYLDMYREAACGRLGREGIERLLIDSYEAGTQTWTPRMEEQFAAHRGYALRGWLPVLAGEIIGSTEESEAFLWDWRKTIAELYEENYDRVRDIAEEYGLRGTYIESHETGRAFCGDGMKVKRLAEIPMSAIWVDDTPSGSPIPFAIADIHESASVAHLYGKPVVAAESFTAEGSHQKAYTYTPAKLKYTADIALSAGLNRFVIHESAAQPGDSFLPGVGLFRYGQWFTRHETWAEYARPWTDYLARSCYMMQQGRAMTDILFYYGEDSNVTSQFGGKSFNDLPEMPDGYEYDFINPFSLLNTVRPLGGKLVTDSGMSHSILVLSDDCTAMSMPVLERLKEFADAGVVICGTAPVRCTGLLEDKARFGELVSDIWDSGRANVFVSLDEAIAFSGCAPDFICSGRYGYDGIRYVHRTLPDADIYWVRNFGSRDSSDNSDITFSFRCRHRYAAVFDPEDGSITDFSDCLSRDAGRTTITLPLDSGKAVFIVLTDRTLRETQERTVFADAAFAEIPGPWRVEFNQKGGDTASILMDSLISWSESTDPVIRYYSGTGIYTAKFNFKSTQGSATATIIIDLGDVKEMAEVVVNGISAGVLWRAPFRTSDISHLLREGENILTVKVTNTWVNRMIGDKQPDTKEKVTRVTRFYEADDPLLPSGLLGPVRIINGI